jgi:hypothetical protein
VFVAGKCPGTVVGIILDFFLKRILEFQVRL